MEIGWLAICVDSLVVRAEKLGVEEVAKRQGPGWWAALQI